MAAFSLVEVALALAIVSTAFIAIFGLLPVGLNNFKQALDNSIGSQIVQRLVNEAQQTDYSELIKITAAQPSTRYFDNQGSEVTSYDDSIYTAQVSVTTPTVLPNTSTPPTANLATVTILLANNPAHRASPFDPANKVRFNTYTALVARNQ